MEGTSALLEIIISAKDQATEKIKQVGEAVDKAAKQAENMSTAFKVAGGILVGTGVAGLGAIKMLTDAASDHQVAMASVDATLKNVSSSLGSYTEVVGGSTTSTKESKKAIQEQIRELELQKSQLTLNNATQTESVTVTTGHGKTLKEHTKIVHENAASITAQKNAIDQQIISLKESELGMSKSGTTTGGITKVIDNASLSYENLKKAADKVSDSYLRLGFVDHDTQLAFAQDVRVTKNVTDAQTMLQASADLSRLKHIDLGTATTMLTMAYEGNTRALKALGIEVPKGAKGIENVAAVEKAAAGQAEAYTKTWAGANEVLSVNFEKLKVALGDRFLPILTNFIGSISGVIERLNKLNPQTVDTIAKILLFGTAFSLVVGPLLLFVGFLPAIISGFGAMAAVALPVVAILAGVALGAYLLYTHWNQVTQALSATKPYIEEVITSFSRFWTWLQPRIQIAIDIIVMAVQLMLLEIEAFWLQHGAKIMATVQDIWRKTVAAFQAILSFVVPVVQTMFVEISTVMGAIYESIITHWSSIQAATQFVWDTIVAFIRVTLDAITGIFKILGDAWKGNWTGVLNDLLSLFVNIWNDIKNVVKDVINDIIDEIDNVIKGVNTIVAKVPGGKGIQIPLIPKFEQGGFVPNTGLAMLHAGEFVLSKDMLAGKKNVPSQVSNTTQNNTPINIYANISNELDLNLIGNKLAFAIRNSR